MVAAYRWEYTEFTFDQWKPGQKWACRAAESAEPPDDDAPATQRHAHGFAIPPLRDAVVLQGLGADADAGTGGAR